MSACEPVDMTPIKFGDYVKPVGANNDAPTGLVVDITGVGFIVGFYTHTGEYREMPYYKNQLTKIIVVK